MKYDPIELDHPAPDGAKGSYAEGFGPVARRFAYQIRSGQEVGAGLTVFHRGELVVDLWGGMADPKSGRPWERSSRLVLFSVTKGIAAMALALLADRGDLEWDAPVTTYWPEFGRAGKEGITLRTLFNHRAGLPYLGTPLTMEDCLDPTRAGRLRAAMEGQRPAWAPGTDQGYHALTYGMYAKELIERIAGEPINDLLRREILEPLGSDVYLGAPAELDAEVATLYPPNTAGRLGKMLASTLLRPHATEARMAKQTMSQGGMQQRTFLNPSTGSRGVLAYNDPPVRRAALAWASATGSAHGLARSYLPLSQGGEHGGRRYFKAEGLYPIYRRQSWSEQDRILAKPIGWSQGFLKEERHIFCPNPESFGHAGMGGALGWCDPVDQVAFGYVMNKMDWKVRSPRCVALCRALYECEPLLPHRR